MRPRLAGGGKGNIARTATGRHREMQSEVDSENDKKRLTQQKPGRNSNRGFASETAIGSAKSTRDGTSWSEIQRSREGEESDMAVKAQSNGKSNRGAGVAGGLARE